MVNLEKTSTERPALKDIVVVLGKNISPFQWDSSKRQIRKSSDNLSNLSRWNVMAAGEKYQLGETIIVFAGGQTAGPGVLSEAAAMKKFFLQRLHAQGREVNNDDIMLEEISYDTAGNAENVAKMLPIDRRSVSLVSVSFHLPNAATLFRNNGVPIDKLIDSAEVVASLSPQDKRRVKRRMHSPAIKLEEGKEVIKRELIKRKKTGHSFRVLTDHTRKG